MRAFRELPVRSFYRALDYTVPVIVSRLTNTMFGNHGPELISIPLDEVMSIWSTYHVANSFAGAIVEHEAPICSQVEVVSTPQKGANVQDGRIR